MIKINIKQMYLIKIYKLINFLNFKFQIIVMNFFGGDDTGAQASGA